MTGWSIPQKSFDGETLGSSLQAGDAIEHHHVQTDHSVVYLRAVGSANSGAPVVTAFVTSRE